MDENDLQHLPCEGGEKKKFKRCKSKQFKNSSYTAEGFGVLKSLLIDKAFCDVKLETDDGTVVHGHKLILISASPYFRAMFTSFEERNKDHIVIKGLNSTSLKLLINYIYSGEIIVNEENVKDMLAAADLIQLDYIRAACEEFLQTQLNPSNCLGIRAFADLHNCTDLISSSDAYIKKQFLEVAKYNEFLRLSPEEVIQLISLSDLDVPKEEYVFESVMNWVKHELGCRKQFLPDLMEHVRLPLTSKPVSIKQCSRRASPKQLS
ncbi:ring canal kelch protein isoform X2 [Acyrthosiphon pisum]|uniref:BTB domain-containing protein n=1 Tax=Acyrthosiphon pisum TaxID=7029 RepID=A0A8R2D2R8_ACYPI|nr:ring canal kelch protein isoform X2 [Acyrthosiphon pisum]XP_016658627.1 ring canal kelch protein isoform X2 [Acyrthosiphon pisum]XP_016658628.1 ring canal kelch protein isoform X2 [Acyrthosiphon pisum]|eukprot:XP_016658626.1 PREDICTED: ring canal kelch protein isoform X2 [Acyrthosiphon pisum]